jgi:hypothetical protein
MLKIIGTQKESSYRSWPLTRRKNTIMAKPTWYDLRLEYSQTFLRVVPTRKNII